MALRLMGKMPMLLRQSEAGFLEGGEDPVGVLVLPEPSIDDSALRIDDIVERQDAGLVSVARTNQPRGGLGRIEHAREGHAILTQESAGNPLVVRAVEAEEYRALVPVVLVQLLKTGDLLAALGRPRVPYVEPDDSAAVVRQPELASAGRA